MELAAALPFLLSAAHRLPLTQHALYHCRTQTAQKYLQQQCADKPAWASWPGKQPLVTVVLFAAPNAGNAEFVADYNTRVNTRNVNFVYDLVSQVRATHEERGERAHAATQALRLACLVACIT